MCQVLQIQKIMTAGNTGQLSQLTAVMNAGGTLVRTFTTAVIYLEDPEGDCLGLICIVTTFLCNCIIVSQVIVYQDTKKEKKEK